MNLTNQNAPATKRQLFALFVGTGLKTNNCVLTVRQASNLIDNMKNGIDIESDLRSFGAIGKGKNQYKILYQQAHEKSMEAAENHTPKPMVVNVLANPLDDSSVKERHIINDGVCGFAWVNIKPGNCAFANFLKKNNLAKKDNYAGGVTMFVHEFGQSYEKKKVYADTFADYLRKNGIKMAYSFSKID